MWVLNRGTNRRLEKLHNYESMICTISLLNEETNDASARRGICKEYWWGKLKEKNKLKDVDING